MLTIRDLSANVGSATGTKNRLNLCLVWIHKRKMRHLKQTTYKDECSPRQPSCPCSSIPLSPTSLTFTVWIDPSRILQSGSCWNLQAVVCVGEPQVSRSENSTLFVFSPCDTAGPGCQSTSCASPLSPTATKSGKL